MIPGRHPLGRWVVIREGERRRWGGELRRRHIFSALAARTHAAVIDRWTTGLLVAAVRGPEWRAPLLRRPLRRFLPRPRLASSELLPEKMIPYAIRLTDATAVAVYDDAVAQLEAMGVAVAPERIEELRRRRMLNLELFRWQVVPTRSFAELVGLDLSRVIVGGHGTDTEHVTPPPWPIERRSRCRLGGWPRPRGRGRRWRPVSSARTSLSSGSSSGSCDLAESEAYLDGLRAQVSRDQWIELGTAPYDQLGAELSRATVLAIAHPASAYMDVILPVKLFDSMAAGRPLVVTPRTETVAVVRDAGAGVVAAGDTPEDIAAAALTLLTNDELARSMGAAGRAAAVEQWDWRVRSAWIADALLEREGLTRR